MDRITWVFVQSELHFKPNEGSGNGVGSLQVKRKHLLYKMEIIFTHGYSPDSESFTGSSITNFERVVTGRY